MFIVLFWAKNIVSETIHINLSPLNLLILLIIGLQAKMTVKPLSPLCIWVHIIENENKS
jgi:hypothetical protein